MKRLLDLGESDWPAPVALLIIILAFSMMALGATADQAAVVLNAGTLMIAALGLSRPQGPGQGLLA
ncbi:MAG: hypothetical protein ABWX68_08315 [Arthrobacter sp.]|uniref:hypothetical protein n=1 Tax=Arthrobacter sp. TaxID=1667 RepID=UPI0034786C1F